jgi:hypothetical protein
MVQRQSTYNYSLAIGKMITFLYMNEETMSGPGDLGVHCIFHGPLMVLKL